MEETEFIDIPLESLKKDILLGIVDEFILQEGTDYGLEEYSLDEKRSQVIKQLQNGRARIVFDPKTESCLILPIYK